MHYLWQLIRFFFITSIIFFPLIGEAKQRLNNPILDLLINHDVSIIGEQLYYNLQQQRWIDAEVLLQHYQQLPRHEVLLVYYAKAQLALAESHFSLAEFYYQQQLKQKADFIPAQIGLIYLYFYQQDYIKAKNQLKKLSETDNLSKSINNKVAYYQAKLSPYFYSSRFYQLGFIYNDNINLASDYQEQIVSDIPFAKVTRKGGRAKGSVGISHFFSLYQPYIINRIHSVSIYFHAQYMDYLSYRDNNYVNFYTQFNYQYQYSHYQFKLSPFYEIKVRDKQHEYQSIGLNSSLFIPLLRKHAINISGNYKNIKYRDNLMNLNTKELSAIVTLKYNLNKNSLLLSQINYQENRKKNNLLNHHQYGIKIGVSSQLPLQWHIDLSLRYRINYFNNYNPLLKKKRKDNEITLSAVVKKQVPIFWGFYPVTELRYTRNLSNVAWLYSYQQQEVIFKLEKQF
ncbi:TPR repeat-containing protein [Proteus hauseri ATCC 700826]|uniref:TPR repeat-containing protein n=1 Tax=Proteus hauseri ATCC 700826 TaxID=1354271 RepID=A0AAJ3LVK2_PROHU|nr:surface lipoprotein assembly modifier [Proteus hauseri]OAT50547.1 TPR repeat-containing protein [Proteus hauseri ATCC 700826]